MKIAILGAGWAGCHISLFLKNKNHKVFLFEKNNQIFTGASGNNQFRHHKGYHYPRSLKTINMLRDNGVRFERDYSFCLNPIPYNYYAISNYSSLIDEGIYEKIFPELVPVKETVFQFKNLIKIYKTNESLILLKLIKEFFNEKLKDNLITNQELNNYKEYDLIIDCTNNNNNVLNLVRKDYKLYIIKSLVDIKNLFSLTVMDGDFCSIYPYDEGKSLYTLSHVKYSDMAIELTEKERLEEIINSVSNFFCDFKNYFRIIGSFVGRKNFNNNTRDASRLLEYSIDNNLLSFSMNKIMSIYEIEDIVAGIV